MRVRKQDLTLSLSIPPSHPPRMKRANSLNVLNVGARERLEAARVRLAAGLPSASPLRPAVSLFTSVLGNTLRGPHAKELDMNTFSNLTLTPLVT